MENDEEVFNIYYKDRDKFIIKGLSKLKTDNKLLLRYNSGLMKRIQGDIYDSLYHILNNRLIQGIDFVCDKDQSLNDLMFDFYNRIEILRPEQFKRIFESYTIKNEQSN